MDRAKLFYQPRIYPLVFLAGFLALSLYYNYQEILFEKPQGIHKWRQTDCASQAYNYMDPAVPFLEPQILNQGLNKEGKTASDFPLIYFTVGKIWSAFGQAEWMYRGLVLFLFLLATFLLYKTAEDVLKDSFLGIIIGLFMFVSPVVAFYACNYLMNVPALSFAVMGVYFFWRYFKTEKYYFLLLFALFSLVAGLLKASSLAIFAIAFGLYLLELVKWQVYSHRPVFRKKLPALIPFLLVFALVFCWIRYAEHYNNNNIAGVFLIGILPLWGITYDQFLVVIDHVWENMKWSYFRLTTQFILFGALLFSLFAGFRFQSIWKWIMFFFACAFITFFILFFEVLGPHDYYLIDFFFLAPLILLFTAQFIQSKWLKFAQSGVLHLLLLIFLISNAKFTHDRLRDQYIEGTWQNADYYSRYQALEELQPKLEELGIGKDAKIVAMPDPSFNISLYYLQRKGWTEFWSSADDSTSLDNLKTWGAEYFFVTDTAYLTKAAIKKNAQFPIHTFRNVTIYKLK